MAVNVRKTVKLIKTMSTSAQELINHTDLQYQRHIPLHQALPLKGTFMHRETLLLIIDAFIYVRGVKTIFCQGAALLFWFPSEDRCEPPKMHNSFTYHIHKKLMNNLFWN